ncbi:hypothetical protein D9M71_706530 [compost metagenome]
MARATIASPASIPWPTFKVWIPASTSSPNPRAPIIDATTTIDKAIMTDWLSPAMILGSARGRAMRRNRCQRLAPRPCAACSNEGSIWLKPSSVNRTSGGRA